MNSRLFLAGRIANPQIVRSNKLRFVCSGDRLPAYLHPSLRPQHQGQVQDEGVGAGPPRGVGLQIMTIP